MTSRRMEEAAANNPATNTTEIVHSLFGSVVGQCLTEYSCSYHRQSAKLYITDRKFLVYSNVFGFERRLCLDWNEVDLMELYRTTSIRICTIDGEEFVVRSLVDRESTLRQLQQVKRAENDRFGTLIGHQFPPSPSRANGIPRASSSGGRLPALPEQSPLRRRASSAPVVSADEANGTPARRGSNESAPMSPAGGSRMVPLNSNASPTTSNRPHLTSVGSINSSNTIHESLEQSWHYCKQQQRDPKDQVAVELKLPCDLTSFFDRFLADDAPHSLRKFQETAIGDSNIVVTPWKLVQSSSDCEASTTSGGGDEELHPSTYTRTITFTHPISSVPLMGPSSALARREQILKRFGSYGILLEMATYVQGIPASDSMYVDVRWIVEPLAEPGCDGVTLTVLHQTRFTKSTMLRKVICASTKAELTTWYTKYRAMIEDVVLRNNDAPDDDEEDEPEPPSTPVLSNGKHHSERQPYGDENTVDSRVVEPALKPAPIQQGSSSIPGAAIGIAVFVAVCAMVFMLVISNWILSQQIRSLEAEMSLLRSELRTLTGVIAQQHSDETVKLEN